MALPKIDQPIFTTNLISNGELVRFRPFTVKEEKILLIAKESEDEKQTIEAIKQILSNCLHNYDVEKLSVFDVQYLMLQIRSKSVDNNFKFITTDPQTEEKVIIELDIDDLIIERNETHNPVIQLTDTIYLKMKYPTIDTFYHLKQLSNPEGVFSLMENCMESVIDGDSVFKIADHTRDEIQEFFDSLSDKKLLEIKNFFETLPKVKFKKTYTNSNGKEVTLVIEGTETFLE